MINDRERHNRRLIVVSFMVILALGVYSLARGFNLPLSYATAQWFTNYEFGFIKRGLVGTIVSPLFRYKSGSEIVSIIHLLSATIFVVKLAMLVWFTRFTLHRTAHASSQLRRVVFIAALVFAGSPHVVFSAHSTGYFDHLLEICTILAITAIVFDRYWLVAATCIVGLAIHEMFAAYGLPVVGVAVLLRVRSHDPGTWSVVRQLFQILKVAVPVLAFGVFLVVSQQRVDDQMLQAIETSANAYEAHPKGSIANMVKHLGEDVSDSWKMQKKGRFKQRILKNEAITVMYPTLVFFMCIIAVLLLSSSHRKLLTIVLPVACMPLLINAIAWDWARFASFAIFQAYMLLLCVLLFCKRQNALSHLQHAVGLALGGAVLINSLLQPVPLMAYKRDKEGLFFIRDAPTVQSFSSCRKLFKNAGFEATTLEPWQQYGDAFALENGVLASSTINRHAIGEQYLCSFSEKKRTNGETIGNLTTGRLVSPSFTITSDAIMFLIGGGNNLEQQYVALFVDGKEIFRATGRNTNLLSPVLWDVGAYREQRAHIEIGDLSGGQWGHINADQFCWTQ